MTETPPGRTSVNAHTTPFLPYDLEGRCNRTGCLLAVFEWRKDS